MEFFTSHFVARKEDYGIGILISVLIKIFLDLSDQFI